MTHRTNTGTYTLSNRQRKDLLVRGTPLLIALPLSDPEMETADLVAYARRVIAGIDTRCIRQAKVVETSLSPWVRGGAGLALVYGTLNHSSNEDLPEPLTVAVIEVRIEPAEGSRHSPGRLEWPGTYRCPSGAIWPSKADTCD